MPTVAIIGVGRVGGAISIALSSGDNVVEHLIGKVSDISLGIITLDEIHTISSDIVIISVNDDAIEAVSQEISKKIAQSAVVLHTSGSLSSDVLSVVRDAGCSVGSMHPLASISSSELGSERFRGAYFCIEGDPRAIAVASKLVKHLGGIEFTIPSTSKALYHAAAVTASGHVTALIDLAAQMMNIAGVPAENSLQILIPLIRSTIANISDQGTEVAITGPFARADIGVFERQRASILTNLTYDEAEIYFNLARRSLRLAVENGACKERVSELDSMIRMAKNQLAK